MIFFLPFEGSDLLPLPEFDFAVVDCLLPFEDFVVLLLLFLFSFFASFRIGAVAVAATSILYFSPVFVVVVAAAAAAVAIPILTAMSTLTAVANEIIVSNNTRIVVTLVKDNSIMVGMG
jgi:hypothetical protein